MFLKTVLGILRMKEEVKMNYWRRTKLVKMKLRNTTATRCF